LLKNLIKPPVLRLALPEGVGGRFERTLIASELGSARIAQVIQDIGERLEKRLGQLHARLRLGIEADHEAQVFGQGINYFHIENLPPSHVAIRLCLELAGVYGRGHRNAAQIELRQHDVTSLRIPKEFDGFRILQLSDCHARCDVCGACTHDRARRSHERSAPVANPAPS
jgi:hypothetical protein